jgi:DnaJ-class molecular chaperone
MTPLRAAALLQLRPPFTAAEVRSAFNRRARETHPDSAGVAEFFDMSDLVLARDMLLQDSVGQNGTCRLCSGLGIVRGRLGALKCGQCRGTGEVT